MNALRIINPPSYRFGRLLGQWSRQVRTALRLRDRKAAENGQRTEARKILDAQLYALGRREFNGNRNA